MRPAHEAKRFLGLELAGAKNQKTSVAVLEYFAKERKIFLLDIFDHIMALEHQSGDDALLEVLKEESPGVVKMGVNVPLELPVCITCARKSCIVSARCAAPAVKWMRALTRKAAKTQTLSHRVREFTPYTQRPVELWIRHQILPLLPESNFFEIDEALGGNRAPLTARMHFLKRHLTDIPLVEVWPKLSIAVLAAKLGVHKRIASSYRHLEYGVHAREEILIGLSQKYELFVYERDMKKISHSLTAFDAFICAFTALLSHQNQCVKAPKGFPIATGWVQYPKWE
jgi:hypothetical protein